MKKETISRRKRMFSALLTLVMLFGFIPAGFVPAAYAATHTEADGIWLGGNSARLTNKVTGNTGTLYSINNHFLSGRDAFCLDPTIESEVGTDYTCTGTGASTTSGYWNSMSAEDQRLVAGIAVYYANNPYASYLTPGMGHQPGVIAKAGAQYAVISCMVTKPWTLDEQVDDYAWSDVKQYAEEAISWARSQSGPPEVSIATPSFDGQIVELLYNSSKEMYVGSVTDSNGAISWEGYDFSQSVNGIQVTQEGNTVTITATPSAVIAAGLHNESNSWSASATVSKSSYDPIDLGAIAIYERYGYQPLFVYEPFSVQPTTVSKTATIRAYAGLLGTARVQKSSSDPAISNNNSCYSLGGAVYGIYQSEEDASAENNALATVTTNVAGESDTAELSAGNYFLKELAAPSGFALNTEIVPFSVNSGQTTTIQVSDVPVSDPIPILLKKIDEATGLARPAGNMSLAGAEYRISFYGGQYGTAEEAETGGSPLRSWTVKTDEDGFADLRDPSCLVSGDELWYSAAGEISFPLGSVVIYETKAPDGYKLNPTHHIVNITDDGQGSSAVRTYNAPELPESPYLGGVTVKKEDAEQTSQQGDASFAGARFGLINENNFNITINGVETAPGEVALEIETDADGIAASGQVIPLGSYSLKEIQPPEGYEWNAEWTSEIFEITADGQTVDVGICDDIVVRGGLSVQKLDSDTLSAVPRDGASLAGAEIEIRNASEHPVIVNSISYEVGAVIAVISTDEYGVAETEDNLLPYGSYELVETKAPEGYGINLDWNPTIEIHGSEKVFLDGELALIDDAARGDVSFIKVDGTNMRRLQNIPFRITSRTTGESHIAVTDVNGVFNSAELDKTDRTNGNDAAVMGDTVDESLLDSSCGIWFSGRNAASGPRNEKGAFPYDTYVFEELPTSANALYELVSFEVVISQDGQNLDVGTVDDNPLPHLTTELLDKDTNDHIAAAGYVTLNDKINYYALRIDKDYEITGTLVDQNTGEPILQNYAAVTATTGSFRPPAADGVVTISFSFDASQLAGRAVVSVVTLLEDGVPVCLSDDLNNTDETVHFPDIHTLAHGENGEKEFPAERNIRVIDTVSYSNLLPGTSYTVMGLLVDALTGTVPTDTDGNSLVVTAEKVFRAEEADGSVDIVFDFDASGLAGETLVAFESLLRNSVVIAEHKDLHDQDQTVRIPYIGTTLLADNDSHMTAAVSAITVTDTVVYSGLQPGMPYMMTGMLMDKSTGEKALDAYGREITASTGFIADETGSGEVELVFFFNGTNLAGSAVVAFEEVSSNGYLVCSHTDLNDENQTVWFPRIQTNAFGVGEDKEVFATENGMINDTVAHWSLIPDREYTLIGILMDKDTGEPALDSHDNPIWKTLIFTPTSKDGSENMVFEADLTALAGHTLVVFESLTENGELLAEHRDLTDVSQTITLPKIWTLAHGEDGSHEMLADDQITIIDTVMYENLVAGKTYTVSGTLMDKKTNTPVCDRNGDPVTAISTFVAERTNGSIDVSFVFDASNLKNSTIVAFERLSNEVTLVSAHEDIDDEDQTIRIPEIATTLQTDRETHVVPAGETVTLTDTVRYSNLTVGNKYTVTGVLLDRETGSEVLQADGSRITASREFTAETADGAVDLVFTVNSNALVGRTIVAFEDLSNSFGIIATHKDLTDENQTVYIPDIHTSLTCENGEKDCLAGGTQTLVDTVTFQGLLPGGDEDYKLVAVLMDRSTDSELLSADGSPITAEVSFAAQNSEGTVEVPFSLEACENLAGHTLVAFETLYYRDEKVAEHRDIQDADQSVFFPAIETCLTADNGEHVSYPGAFDANGVPKDLTLTDTVDYKNLIPGKTYLLEGVLMRRESGEAYLDKNGNESTASAIFVPEQAEGQAELTFLLPADGIDPDELTGNTLVAFETLYRDGRKIAEHAEIGDESQSIHFPCIRTSVKAEDGTHTVSLEYDAADITITDTVTYRNLEPGLTYKMVGTLMDYETHGILREPGGSPIIAETEFTPWEADGTIDVVFRFNARNIIGKKAVVFESLMLGQSLLAEHKDIEDTEQMIQFPHLIRVFKYDAGDRHGLADAEFRIVDKGLSNSSDAVTLLETQTVTSDENGYFYFNSLPGHQYSITEQKAPAGYLVASGEYIINVGEEGTIEGDTEIPNVHGGTVVITKTDVITGIPLSGCEISIYKVVDETADRRELVFKQRTDGKGRIYFYTLDKGTYVFKETADCDGYYLNEEEFVFKIKADGSVVGDTRITNVPYGTVVIKKVDASGKPLAGAQLAFYDANNRYLGQGVSDAKGRIYFVSPGPGEYCFTEVKAPEGYGLVTERYRFRIGTDFTISGTLKLVNSRTSTPYSKTGDHQNLGLWVTITAASLILACSAGACFMVRRKKNRTRENQN